jgi:hypothetical protein
MMRPISDYEYDRLMECLAFYEEKRKFEESHPVWVVLKRNNRAKCASTKFVYVGAPCMSYEQAIDMMKSYGDCGAKIEMAKLENNATYFDEVDLGTGELIATYKIFAVENFG